MKKKIVIAIDGHSSTGKSTLAKQLAKALNYIYVDTGAMYRAVTYYALKKGYIDKEHFDKQALINDLDVINISFKYNPELGFAEVYLNDENIEKEIRKMYVSGFVSEIATIPEVRKKLVIQQQQIGKEKGIVMDGRDIGSVVFPDAELKIFMTASSEVRAQRRYDEIQAKGQEVSYDEVLQNVIKRDKIDSTRATSPLIKTPDAVVIDNSRMTRDEQLKKVLELADEVINTKPEK